jgi:hypothetical protein
MNAELIDNIFLSETEDVYFYAAFCGSESEDFVYGGCYENDELYDVLIAMYNIEPLCRPDLIRFAQEILHSTDS